MPTTGGTFTGDVAFYGGVLGGTILTLGTLVPGDGYDFGAYFNVTLTGGTGVGATADISVGFDGGVADVTLVNPGTGYTVGDSLTAFSTFGTPWSILVDTVTVGVPGATIIDGVGSCGTAGQVLTSNGFNALCWRSLSAATPTVAGIVKGFINATNTALGCNAAVSLTTGLSNTALGTRAGAALTDGCCNTFIGNSAGCSAQFALGQTIIGVRAGNTLTSGFYNVFVGAEAGASATQSRNVFIGACAGCAQTTGSSNVAIGDGVNVPVTTAGCQLAIGYSSGFVCWLTGNKTGAIKPGAGIIDCANSCGTIGQYLWTTGANKIIWSASSPSDTRDKEVLGPVPTALPVVQQIEPITYHWKERESEVAQEEVIYGFSAQQLQEVDPVLVDDSDPDYLRIHDRKIVPLLVKAIQELSAKVDSLQTELNTLKANG
jgi:hypothetical protein